MTTAVQENGRFFNIDVQLDLLHEVLAQQLQDKADGISQFRGLLRR
ncbi:hypothetical protein [Scopulibacillus daqui]|nr:hypothetical protein [Scopulibacillus daqui]